jgi:hypothetical protein
MGFSNTRRPQKDHIGKVADKGQVKERHDQFAIQFRLEGKVKLIDALDKGQPGDLQSRIDPALLFLGDFFLEQVVEKSQIRCCSCRLQRDVDPLPSLDLSHEQQPIDWPSGSTVSGCVGYRIDAAGCRSALGADQTCNAQVNRPFFE